MRFYPITSQIKRKESTYALFQYLESISQERDGFAYHQYPIAGGMNKDLPEIVLVDAEFGISAIDVIPKDLDSIFEINEEDWIIDDEHFDSPLLKLEDYKFKLNAKFGDNRILRGNKVKINTFLVLPLINQRSFKEKFDFEDDRIIFNNFLELEYDSFFPKKSKLDETESKLFLAISQGAGSLNNKKRIDENVTSTVVGEAIRLVDSKISELDVLQQAAAIQIPDGPQRIRGMAGTGKTIILTMKAAFLHSKYPEKKILYTFNTQSLYNQVKNLITKFYRDYEEHDPNWENLLILHAWGGKSREGVYHRTCLRNSVEPIPYGRAKYQDDSFDYVCKSLLESKINSEFDFVLVDEAQDLPNSFFQILYEITTKPKRIIFAYDELQDLSHKMNRDVGEMFGYNKDGTPKVDFSAGEYEGGIEMDFVLKKSYRNPLEVLMIAHGIGLGLYNSDGFMQLINNKGIWESIGYQLIQGQFTKGEKIILERPTENSRSIVREIYQGEKPILVCQKLNSRKGEIDWIAKNILNDIKNEKVKPHDIVVITLNKDIMVDFYTELQYQLYQSGIPSIIPGIGGVDRDQFAENGFVTLSTVYKAKGNEAFIIYIANFDYLYDYVEFVTARNIAFTSISRTKGWCRITGIGAKMVRAITEIQSMIDDIPQFKFTYPDKPKIARQLSTEEYARRIRAKNTAKQITKEIVNIEDEAWESIGDKDKVKAIKKLLSSLPEDEAEKLLAKFGKGK